MLMRYEYNIQTGIRRTINQIVYRNEEGETIVLDDGESTPHGFTEYTGDLTEEPQAPE